MAGYAAERAKEIFLRGIKENDIIIIYDLETTGLSPVNNHIIQLSARACLIADAYRRLEENPGTLTRAIRLTQRS